MESIEELASFVDFFMEVVLIVSLEVSPSSSPVLKVHPWRPNPNLKCTLRFDSILFLSLHCYFSCVDESLLVANHAWICELVIGSPSPRQKSQLLELSTYAGTSDL